MSIFQVLLMQVCFMVLLFGVVTWYKIKLKVADDHITMLHKLGIDEKAPKNGSLNDLTASVMEAAKMNAPFGVLTFLEVRQANDLDRSEIRIIVETSTKNSSSAF